MIYCFYSLLQFSQLQIDTIAAIRHSALEGHTVVMSETDSVHESFYDLFNQRFRCIEDPKTEPRYFTNIAIGAHSRPCRVNPNFQCVVIVKESEVKQTPAPFLNRFEKYRITHSTLLTTVLAPLPPLLKKLVMAAKEKVCILCGSNDVIVLVLQKAMFFYPPCIKSTVYHCEWASMYDDTAMLFKLHYFY